MRNKTVKRSLLILLTISMLCALVFIVAPMFGDGTADDKENADAQAFSAQDTNPSEPGTTKDPNGMTDPNESPANTDLPLTDNSGTPEPVREVESGYQVCVQGRLDTGTAYLGRESYLVAFQIKTVDGKTIANVQTLSLAYDTGLFEFGAMGSEMVIPNEDISSTAWASADELAAAYTDWTAKLYLRLSADGRTGYVDMEPYRTTGLMFTGLSLPDCESVQTVRLVFKEGKSFADMKPDSVRLMTIDELAAMNLYSIAGISDGTSEYNYGLAAGTQNTLHEPILDLHLPPATAS